MSKKIEILENTLLKLLVRRGPNIDRLNVVLSEGELGYTTDTKRLYVGDGINTGGRPVGSRFLGFTSNPLITLAEAEKGDFAFFTSDNKLYVLDGDGDFSKAANWRAVGTI